MTDIQDKCPIKILINDVSTIDKVTYYDIKVNVGKVEWKTSHRYNDFADLHNCLVSDHGLTCLLPPKKIIGNKDPNFIEKRKKELELYLQNVLEMMMTESLPEKLIHFLEIQHYETNFILRQLSSNFYEIGEELLEKDDFVSFNSLQLMCISKQMRSANNPLFEITPENDSANTFDFCSNVKKLLIEGDVEPYRNSNIKLDELPYNLNAFKNLENLKIINSKISQIESLGSVRSTLKNLTINNCNLNSVGDILLCDDIHKDLSEHSITEKRWHLLEKLDLNSNSILELDKIFILTPKLKHLSLKGNLILSIEKVFTKLPSLVHLNLSNNRISQLNDLHLKMGNITHLDISQNVIQELNGLSKLYSVVYLNLSSNIINSIAKVEPVCVLPCLDYLNLSGNPVTTLVDYRIKVLEHFGKRASEVCLDNEKPTRKELDKVAVLQALKSAREGRLPTLSIVTPVRSNPFDLRLDKPDIATIAQEYGDEY